MGKKQKKRFGSTWSIKWKMLVTITFLMVMLISVLTHIHFTLQKRTLESSLNREISLLKENLVERGKNTINNLTQLIENDIAAYDFSGAVDTISGVIEKNRDIKYAVLMNSSGKVFIHTLDPSLIKKDLTEERDRFALDAKKLSIVEYTESSESIIEMINPVQVSTRPWGCLRLVYSLKSLEEQIELSKMQNKMAIKRSFYRIAAISPLIMLVYFVVILIHAEQFSKPIVRLTQLARRLSGRDFSVASEIEIRSNDEVGELETAFIEMSKDLKNSYELLQKNEEKYRLLAENVSDVLWTVDIKTLTFVYVGPAVKQMLGYTSEEVQGIYAGEFTPEGSLEPNLAILAKELEKEKNEIGDPARTSMVEFEHFHKNGSIIQVEAKVRFIYNENGKPIQILGVSRDVTARKHSEAEKKKLETQLHHAQKMETIGTMAGGIAHDFNNILGAIILNTEQILEQELENKKSRNLLKQVMSSSGRAKELIEQILTFSRGKKVDKRPIQVHTVILESLQMLRSMLPATVTIQKEISLDAGAVLADSTQIQQVVMNLCTNAAKAMPNEKGTIKVVLENIVAGDNFSEAELKSGHYVKLEVSDTGTGMTQAVKKRIFDPFFTTRQPGEGTGLGLSVVHGIISTHKGTIAVDSEPDKGTTVKIFLPMVGETAEAIN